MNKFVTTNSMPLSNQHIAVACLAALVLTFNSAALLATDNTGAGLRISSGDKLLISIPGADPPEQDYIVDPAGDVGFGIHGKVHISGLSVDDAEKAIRRHMSQYLISTKAITVLLKEAGKTVLVTGCVSQPGLVTIEATGDLWRAIGQAGGTSPCADLSRVSVARNGQETIYDIHSVMTGATEEKLPPILAGDTIFVSAQAGMSAALDATSVFLSSQTIDRKVFVLGAVTNPGIFDRTEAVDVLTAVSLAGGPAQAADLAHAVVLTKDQSQKFDLQKILLGEEKLPKNSLPKPGDSGAIVFIPTMTDNIDQRMGDHINIIGHFARTGRIPVSGPIALADAIGLAGGPQPTASYRKVRVIEEGPGYTLVSRYNMREYYRHGGFAGRVMVNPGSTIIVGGRTFDQVREGVQFVSSLVMISTAVLVWTTFINEARLYGN